MVSRTQDRQDGGRPLKCPICRKSAQVSYRPFCSKRCADIDLGRWLGGRYAIPTTEYDDEDGVAELSSDDPDGAIGRS